MAHANRCRVARSKHERNELSNGNYEGPLHRFFFDRDHIARWGIRARNNCRDHIPALDAFHSNLRIVRLTSRREIKVWVDEAARRGLDS